MTSDEDVLFKSRTTKHIKHLRKHIFSEFNWLLVASLFFFFFQNWLFLHMIQTKFSLFSQQGLNQDL